MCQQQRTIAVLLTIDASTRFGRIASSMIHDVGEAIYAANSQKVCCETGTGYPLTDDRVESRKGQTIVLVLYWNGTFQ
jgi:hypothetical protein